MTKFTITLFFSILLPLAVLHSTVPPPFTPPPAQVWIPLPSASLLSPGLPRLFSTCDQLGGAQQTTHTVRVPDWQNQGLGRYVFNLGVHRDVQAGYIFMSQVIIENLKNRMPIPLPPPRSWLYCSALGEGDTEMSVNLKASQESKVSTMHAQVQEPAPALTCTTKWSAQKTSFSRWLAFPKVAVGVEEEEGGGSVAFSFLTNRKLAEPKVEFVALTCVPGRRGHLVPP